MNAIDRTWTPEQQALALSSECYETDAWAARALFEVELFTPRIVDPCCGRGVLGRAALVAGYNSLDMIDSDLHDWGHGNLRDVDFLSDQYPARIDGDSVIMNPPFSLACEFVETALARGARKVACFQRWAWWAESRKRRAFFEAHPPTRLWVCGDRATCWLVTISETERRARAGTTTAHGWFIWESPFGGESVVGKIWDKNKNR